MGPAHPAERRLMNVRQTSGTTVAGGLVLAVAVGFAPAAAAPGGGGCQLAGSAAFTPNGPGTADTFGYGFSGALSGCGSTVSGAPTSGTIGAGQVLTEAVPLTVTNPDGTPTTSQVTARSQEPLATGTSNVPAATTARQVHACDRRGGKQRACHEHNESEMTGYVSDDECLGAGHTDGAADEVEDPE